MRADAERLPFLDATFDGVITAFTLRNVVDLDAMLRECVRAPSGAAGSSPSRRRCPRLVWRAGNAVWFRGVVPLLGRLLAHDDDAYRYLPRSTAYLPPSAALTASLEDLGLVDVRHETMTGGSVQLLAGVRP